MHRCVGSERLIHPQCPPIKVPAENECVSSLSYSQGSVRVYWTETSKVIAWCVPVGESKGNHFSLSTKGTMISVASSLKP